MKRIGVLTGGGDCPGLNAVIRAVVRKGVQEGYVVTGVKNGWLGLIDNDMRILDELNPLVNRLLNITEITHSPLWQVNAKLIQSKLGLIQMEFSRAKLFLSQAQQIAEEHDLQMFAQVISNDHDQLLEQEDMWDHLKKAKAPMAERINLASFDGIIAHMEGRRVLEPVELVDEQAILLLIIAEGGSLLFSYTFSEEWKFDDELFGGFLTAFNSISDEIFSEGLDRVKFGKQTFHFVIYSRDRHILRSRNLPNLLRKFKI